MEENELSLDNIVSTDSYELYDGTQDNESSDNDADEIDLDQEDEVEETPKKSTNKNNVTETVDSLYLKDEDDDDESESVGDDEDSQDEDTVELKRRGGSSADNFYSSIANAFREDGVLSNLDEEDFEDIEDADDLRALIDKEVDSRLSAAERSIRDALAHGMEPDTIVKYHNMVGYLQNINDDVLEDESEDGELLRKRLIFQDYINKGFSEDKAMKEVNKSVAAGTDIDDAKEALEENLRFYTNAYNKEIGMRKEYARQQREAIANQTEELQDMILSNTEVFEGVSLDKATRNRIFDTVSKPVVKGPNGQKLTKLQAYQIQYPNDFIYKVGALFELTNGFKDVDKLVKKKVIKKQNENIRNLEKTLKNQSVNLGEPRYIGNGSVSKSSTNNRYSLV